MFKKMTDRGTARITRPASQRRIAQSVNFCAFRGAVVNKAAIVAIAVRGCIALWPDASSDNTSIALVPIRVYQSEVP